MKNALLLLSLFGMALLMLSTGCADRGCTDPAADNFDPFAQRNNGTCIYRGCTDPNSSSYNPQATIDDGSCTYTGIVSFWSSVSCCALEVSVNSAVVDSIQVFYDQNPGCVTGEGIVRVTRPVGTYIINARTITGQQYTWADTIAIEAGDCLTYEFSL